MIRRYAYLGNTRITMEQFEQIRAHILAGERMAAIQLIRTYTSLSLKEAVHIVDHFHTIDFRCPQTSQCESYEYPDPPKPEPEDHSHDDRQEKAQHIVMTVLKGLSMVLFFGVYLIIYVVAGLANPKRRRRR